MNKTLVILGPTSTGKTDVALVLAKRLNGELVSCDSRQVYKGLDIGTGKAPLGMSNVKCQMPNGCWIINGVKIWMYDVADPKQRYTVWRYVKDTRKVIDKIVSVKKIPIIVGGSGLYLKGLFEGVDEKALPNLELRVSLESLSLDGVAKKLRRLSPTVWEKLNESERRNKRRLIRKIEILEVGSGRRDKKDRSPIREALREDFDVLRIGLYAPRPILNQRIDARVDSRIKDGMIEEAEGLYRDGLSLERMKELGLEYGVLANLIIGEIRGVREFREILKTKIHQFAKRQMTWFRNQERDVEWFDITQQDFLEKVEKRVSDWYNFKREQES